MNPAPIQPTLDLTALRAQLADADRFVAEEEAAYNHQIALAADTIAAATDGCQIVWMCGPSSVGKTTTAKRLCAALENRGLQAFVISLDDFYRGIGNAPRLADGSFDYESPEALDLPQLRRCVTELMTTGETRLPRYNFETGQPIALRVQFRITGRTAVIFEGIQAFSPLLTDGIPREILGSPLRLFINTHTRYTNGDTPLLCRRDIRLARRLLRDERTRGSDFEETMSMWQKVLAGDERHIFPYSDAADILINSSLGYEPCVLGGLLADRLPSLYGTAYEATARRLIAAFAQFPVLAPELVPSGSVLREFIGTSCTF
ncbi:MAG: nucleoside kinase [Ruminococcaceae bacterium]|nr:nucleoside kinase [Oscillospiraceae bacterium]